MDPMPLAQLIGGFRQTVLVYLAAKLRLADLLPADAPGLAQRLGVDADALYRVLRGLAALDLLSEEPTGQFALTELGAGLRSEAADLAILAGEEYLPAWGALLPTVRTGAPAFPQVFGMDAWEHRRKHPELGQAFDRSLSVQTAALAESVLAAYDFSAVRQVIDVGGGRGGLLAAILTAHPALTGILFDLPQAVADAKQIFEASPLAPRLQLAAGDFFNAVPTGADLYLLKSVLHDWDDERCGRILRHCRHAMTPSDRLLIVERPLPDHAADAPDTIMLDLHMLAVLGGRERSAAAYARFARQAGLQPVGSFPVPGGFQVMEFRPA